VLIHRALSDGPEEPRSEVAAMVFDWQQGCASYTIAKVVLSHPLTIMQPEQSSQKLGGLALAVHAQKTEILS